MKSEEGGPDYDLSVDQLGIANSQGKGRSFCLDTVCVGKGRITWARSMLRATGNQRNGEIEVGTNLMIHIIL